MTDKNEKSPIDRIWDKHLRQVRAVCELLAESVKPDKLTNLQSARMLLEDSLFETRRVVTAETSRNEPSTQNQNNKETPK